MDLFDRFLQERTYLMGVSPATLRYYRSVGRAFQPILTDPTREGMLECVQRLQASGTLPISINTYLRGLKAYVRWLHAEGHLKEPLRIQFLRTERKVLVTFNAEQIHRMVRYRPDGTNLTRAHMATLVMLDSGLRVSECLGLRRSDVDFDNLLLRVRGKGNKQRIVPMSVELRRSLFRYCTKHSAGDFVFGTARGTRVSTRNFHRDLKLMCTRLHITGVRCSPHTLRHTFAISYLRNGGNLFYLSKILGHTSVTTTEKYLQSLGVEDLQAVHDRLTLLNPGR